jgi:hypothetical protein
MISSLLLSTLLSGAAADSYWTPFLGCWSLVEDEVRRPVVPETEDEMEERDEPLAITCLTPLEEEPSARAEGEPALKSEKGQGWGPGALKDAVRLQTFSGDEAFLAETLKADGLEQPITQGRCHGWQRLDWSLDGTVLFTRSELTCDEGRKRSISGLSFLTSPSTWMEIQSLGSGGSRAVAIRRFREANQEVTRLRAPALSEEEIEAAREARLKVATARVAMEDVIEAAHKVSSEVLEAWLVERGAEFRLDAQTLIRLSDESVPASVIDLMVALSYPEKFQVERPSGGGGAFSSPWYDPYFSAGFAYPYYAAPFGYYYWYAPLPPVYVEPGDDLSVGRAIEGRGYTRVTRVAPSDSGGRRARSRGESGSDSGGSSSDRGGSSSSGGSVSHQGYSRGGSSGGGAKVKKQ